AKSGDKVAQAEIALLDRLIPHLDSGKPAHTISVTDEENKLLKSFFLLSGKPTIFACNVAEADLASFSGGKCDTKTAAGKHVAAVREYVKMHLETEAVVISAQIESELVDFSEEEAADYLRELGVGEEGSGVSSLIRAVYHLLGLQTYLT